MLPKFRMLFAALLLPVLAAPPATATSELDTLAQNVERTESLRAVKNLQRTYAHYVQFGLWDELTKLFTNEATYSWDTQVLQGKSRIAAWLHRRGGSLLVPATNSLTTEMIDEPLINLAADGNSARGRWMGLALLGDSAHGAHIEGGIYENNYVRVNGVWLFSAVHFYPQFAGAYERGWLNWGGKELPLIPFHFTADEAGTPLTAATQSAPASTASLAALEQRIAALNAEDAVRNLQHAYGYYLDRKMWDDVVDLFASDAKLEIAGVGIYTGPAGVRRALQRMGPQGLQHGQLNDHPLFDTIVKVSKGNTEAFARGIELGMLGEADQGKAFWEVNVFRNRFVKEAGVWKIRELRLYPLLKADYADGWVAGRVAEATPDATVAPDHKVVTHYSPGRTVPAFIDSKAIAGKAPQLPEGMNWADSTPLTDLIAPGREANNGAAAAPLAEARRRLARSAAYDGAENVSSAVGYYSDDCQWPQLSAIFAEHGNRQVPLAGFYLGRDRITQAMAASTGKTPLVTRAGISFHWRIQPVILVAADGRSANVRTRQLQPRTGREFSKPGAFYAAGFSGSMSANDQVVLEQDSWRLWSVAGDEPYFTSVDWQGGWSAVKDHKPAAPATAGDLMNKYPPDIALIALGKRAEHFEGGTGTPIAWPGILNMWFNYRNPVSGRTPEYYWRDCVPCEQLPAAKMTSHGYLLPPDGAPGVAN